MSIYASSKICQNCSGKVETDLVPIGYCAQCIAKGMEGGHRLDMVVGTITGAVGGGKYRFHRGESVNTTRKIWELRRAMAITKSREAIRLSHFSDINWWEFVALAIAAEKEGPSGVSGAGKEDLWLSTLRVLSQPSEIQELIAGGPVLLTTHRSQEQVVRFGQTAFPKVLELTKPRGIVTATLHIGWFKQRSHINATLQTESFRNIGCFLFNAGELRDSRLSRAWWAPVFVSWVSLVRSLIGDIPPQQETVEPEQSDDQLRLRFNMKDVSDKTPNKPAGGDA